MTSSYNPPLNRLYPDLEEPQDEELQKVLQLSLITAQEDEARRSRIRFNNSIASSSATSLASNSFPDPAAAAAVKTKTDPEPAKKPAVSVARPRPEPNRNPVSKDYLDCSVPVLPKPVVAVSRNTVASRISEYADREAAHSSVNVSTLLPKPMTDRPMLDSRTLPIPPRPAAWVRSSTPDPSHPVKPLSSNLAAKPDLLATIPAIPIPPRPLRSRPDGPAPNRSHSVPPLKNENQELKANPPPSQIAECGVPENDTFLIQLSPPPCRQQDFDITALDPYCPQNMSPATRIPIPPRPIGFQVPGAATRPNLAATSSVFNSPVPGISMPGSVKNPAYGLLWPPAGGQYSSASVDGSADAINRVARTDLTEPSTDDLMFFAEPTDDPIYLSLEDFDPLFSMDDRKSITGQHPNSSSSHTKPIPPKPAVSNVPSQIGEVGSNQGERSQSSVSDTARGSSDYEELLDPFSLSDLTQSLERKRQKHNAEQELRKTLCRVPEAKQPTKAKVSEDIG